MVDDTAELLTAGLAALSAGCSLIPIDHRTKRPFWDLLPQVCDVPRRRNADGKLLSSRGTPIPDTAVDPGRGAWGDYTRIRPSAGDVRAWVRAGAQLAIVAGAVSGNLECIDFDVVEGIGACLYGAWRETVGDDADGLPLQRTGGRGFQIPYRAPTIAGNLKLAYLQDPTNERSGESIAIETRGEGGYFVIAPSLHPSGRRYAMLAGDWSNIPTIDDAHRERLHRAARELDEGDAAMRSRAARAPRRISVYRPSAGQSSVIDAWCAVHSIERTLEDAGYVWAGRRMYLPNAGNPQRAGVVLLADRSYHHDSDDPLSDGYSHSAFDVWCRFTHEGNVEQAVHAAAVELNLPYAPHGAPTFDAHGFACCPQHGTRLRTGRTSGYFCPSPDPSTPRGWCAYYWRAGDTYIPPIEGAATASSDGANEQARAATPSEPFHRTDLGNARRLVARHGAHIRYIHAWEKWLTWDGGRWAIDETGAIHRLARETVRSIYDEISLIADPDKRKEFAKWAYGNESRNRLAAMVALAQAEDGIPIVHEALDADPYLLGCPDGTIDLRTGQLRAADPADLISKQVAVAPAETAACPQWLAFLQTVLAGDADLIGFVQRAVGMTLTADTREQVLLFMYGSGQNGKSTFIELIMDLLGSYAIKAPTEMLMAKPQGGGIPNDVAQLPGRRLVVTAETEDGRRLNESMVKDLTGDDRMTARFMRGEFFSFKPTHTLWMYGNHKPVIKGTDQGIWRRMRLIPFTVHIPDAQKDPELKSKLRTELPGILRWAIDGCLAWQQQGLGKPAAVEAATEGYRQEMDILGMFLDECCVISPTARVGATELYSAYKAWAERTGERERSQTAFGRYLSDRGFSAATRSDGRKERTGLGLKTSDGVPTPPSAFRRSYVEEPPDSSSDGLTVSDSSLLSPHVKNACGDYMHPLSETVRPSEELSEQPTAKDENGHAPDLSVGLWSDYDRRMVESALAAHKAGRPDKAQQWRGKVRGKVARDWLDAQLAGEVADA